MLLVPLTLLGVNIVRVVRVIVVVVVATMQHRLLVGCLNSCCRRRRRQRRRRGGRTNSGGHLEAGGDERTAAVAGMVVLVLVLPAGRRCGRNGHGGRMDGVQRPTALVLQMGVLRFQGLLIGNLFAISADCHWIYIYPRHLLPTYFSHNSGIFLFVT